MNTSFDPTKPVETRDGRKARIICSDMKDKDKPIVALVCAKSFQYDSVTDQEYVLRYCTDGHFLSFGGEDCLDLVNVPVKQIRYLNIHNKGSRTEWTQNVQTRKFPYFVDGFDSIKLTYEDDKLVKVEIESNA